MARTPEIDLREDYGRNYIINGNFDFWQRGTTFSSLSNSYSADRWLIQNMNGGSTSQADIIRSTDVPTRVESEFQSEYSILCDVTGTFSPGGGIQAGQFQYRLEGLDVQNLLNKKVVLSFWAKATKTGSNGVAVRTFDSGGFSHSWVSEYTIDQSNTWEQKTVIIDFSLLPAIPKLDNTLAVSISWSLAVSDTFETSTFDQWQAVQLLASANQTNHFDNVNNEFRLAQVQLTESAEALPFRRAGRSVGEELSLCQRYYEKSYNVDVDPGTVTTNGFTEFRISTALSNADMGWTVFYKQPKRSLVSVTTYSYATGASNVIRLASGADRTSYIVGNGFNSFCIGYNDVSVTTGLLFGCHWTADAEL